MSGHILDDDEALARALQEEEYERAGVRHTSHTSSVHSGLGIRSRAEFDQNQLSGDQTILPDQKRLKGSTHAAGSPTSTSHTSHHTSSTAATNNSKTFPTRGDNVYNLIPILVNRIPSFGGPGSTSNRFSLSFADLFSISPRVPQPHSTTSSSPSPSPPVSIRAIYLVNYLVDIPWLFRNIPCLHTVEYVRLFTGFIVLR